MTIVIFSAIFVMLFVVLLPTLQRMSTFKETSATVVAFCVALLCVLGMYQFATALGRESNVRDNVSPTQVVSGHSEDTTEDNNKHKIILFPLLLPYAALGLTLLLLPLLFLLTKLGKRTHWQKIVRAYKKLTTVRPHIERESINKIKRSLLLRNLKNGKAKVKSTRKNIHV